MLLAGGGASDLAWCQHRRGKVDWKTENLTSLASILGESSASQNSQEDFLRQRKSRRGFRWMVVNRRDMWTPLYFEGWCGVGGHEWGSFASKRLLLTQRKLSMLLSEYNLEKNIVKKQTPWQNLVSHWVLNIFISSLFSFFSPSVFQRENVGLKPPILSVDIGFSWHNLLKHFDFICYLSISLSHLIEIIYKAHIVEGIAREGKNWFLFDFLPYLSWLPKCKNV